MRHSNFLDWWPTAAYEHDRPTATTEVASSRKRAAPMAQAALVAMAAKTQKTANPYLRTAEPRGGPKRGMNKDLLHAFMQNKSGGARQSMARLHTSLKETMNSRNMYPSRY